VLLVGAANVGDASYIGPTSVDWGATAVYASFEGACCSAGQGRVLVDCRAVLWGVDRSRVECVSESEVHCWSAACWTPIRPVLKHGPRS
jgi:hypothetical protein